MTCKLSEQLHTATLLNDQKTIDRIHEEINSIECLKKESSDISSWKINTVLNNDKSSALKVYDFLNKSLGNDWWEWEIETIDRILFINYATVLEDINRDKVLAIRHLCRNDAAFFDWYEFNQLALAFSSCIADFDFLRYPSPGMIINTIFCMNGIRPDRNGDFGIDVKKYICIILINDGIYTPPPSIFKLIKDIMKNMVSNEVSNLWINILEQYNKFIDKDYENINEDIITIQAQRILKTELSAREYGI